MFSTLINKITQHARRVGMAILVILTLGFYSPADYAFRVQVDVAMPEPRTVEVPCCYKESPVHKTAPMQTNSPVDKESHAFDFLSSDTMPTPKKETVESAPVASPYVNQRPVIGARKRAYITASEHEERIRQRGLYSNTPVNSMVYEDGNIFQLDHRQYTPRFSINPGDIAMEGFQKNITDYYLLTGVTIDDHPLNEEETVRLDLPRDHPYYGMRQIDIWKALNYPDLRPGVPGDARYARYGLLSVNETLV